MLELTVEPTGKRHGMIELGADSRGYQYRAALFGYLGQQARVDRGVFLFRVIRITIVVDDRLGLSKMLIPCDVVDE